MGAPISQYIDQEVCAYFKIYALKSPMRLKTRVYG